MLNEEQIKVVESIDPFIFLLAGAGSGKTRVIIERIKKLIKDGVNPQDILAITFTRKASHEMKERLKHDDVSVHTFHQLCYISLREKLNVVFEIVSESTLNMFTQEQLLAITNYKNSLGKMKKPHTYETYQQTLKSHHELDYDDLLIHAYKALQRGILRFTFQYIFIDEFQDTNRLQYELLKKIARQNTKLFAVGDPDQSIYQFRGASPKIIDLYIKDFQATLYQLKLNYRSKNLIIQTANRIIKRNHHAYRKDLIPTHQQAGIVQSYHFINDEIEADWLVKQIHELIHLGYKHKSIAVLYRNHHRAYHIILKCHQEDIPYHIQDDDVDHMDAIHLMTIHQAKGLEFDIVFLIGCEDHVLPSRRINQLSSIEEERRLIFVGITRARHILCFTRIHFNAERHHFTSSPFILESGVKSSKPKEISDIISLGDKNGYQKTHR